MQFLKRLFGRRPAPAAEVIPPPAPPTLRDTIAAVVARPSLATRAALYRRLPDEQLVVAVAALPEGVGAYPATLAAETPIALLTSDSPSGSVVLAFTDEAALRRRAPEAAGLQMPARQVLELALRDDHTGLVLNPADTWVLVPRVDIARMLAGEYGEHRA